MKLTLLGTGTSHGVPSIGCECAVCTSQDEKDSRFRCSAFLEETLPSESSLSDCENGKKILIDCGPEFRLQCLRAKIRHVDAVLITHAHADHLHGLDDLRIFSFKRWHGAGKVQDSPLKLSDTKGPGLPIYANTNTYADIQNRFDYIFKPAKKGGGIAKLDLKDVNDYSADNILKIGNIEIIPVPMLHGTLKTTGYLFREITAQGYSSIAYLTDCNKITDSSLKIIRNFAGRLEHVVIDALRATPHPTHLSYFEAIDIALELDARHTWLTHISHDNSHEAIKKLIQEYSEKKPELSAAIKEGRTFEPAYDGLVLKNSWKIRNR